MNIYEYANEQIGINVYHIKEQYLDLNWVPTVC